MEKIRIVSFTEKGALLSGRMAEALKTEYEVRQYTTKQNVGLEGLELIADGLKSWCKSCFYNSYALIFIGACGIAVRTIAPFLVTKVSDPAVLVADERGAHLIPLVSGHLGGGNELAEYLAAEIGADPVITTSSDVNGKLAVDVWAKKNGLYISDMTLAKRAAAGIVAGRQIPFYCEGHIRGTVPKELRTECCPPEENPESEISIAVSVYDRWGKNVLRLIPKAVIVGVGCRRGKSSADIKEKVFQVLKQYHVATESILKVVSIDLKAGEEGLLALAGGLGVPFETYPAGVLLQAPGVFAASDFVKGITGVDNVCERAAVAALPVGEQKNADFICRKTAADGVTVALVCREWSVSFE